MHTAKRLKELGCIVSENEPMRRHTTIGTGGAADILCVCPDMEAARRAYLFLYEEGIPFEVIGRGSNVLVSDRGYRGVILKFYGDRYIKALDEGIIYCSGGAGAKSVALYAIERGLTGLEFAAAIPGSIGGHICMNAGCYGSEMKDIVQSVGGFIEGKEVELTCESCGFSHRESVFLGKKSIILWAKLRLSPGDGEAALRKLREINAKKRQAQPLEFPSCGSVFKRDGGIIPSKLIDEAGLKGLKAGGAEVSAKHAGFIINRGGATSADIYALICAVKRKIFQRYGIALCEEISYIGEF